MQIGDAAVDFERLLSATRRGRSEERRQPLGMKQALRQMLGHQVVELLHRDRAALAGGLALPGAGRAGVIFMDCAGFRRSGAQGHGAVTGSAECDAGQKNGSGDDARRGDTRITGFQGRLHRVEFFPFDDRWNVDDDMLARRLLLERLGAAPIEDPAADIDRVGQDLVHRADAEQAAGAAAIAARVEPGGDLLDADRTGFAVAEPAESENRFDGLGFDRIDDKPFFDARTALFHFLDLVAERKGRAVIKTLAGVFLHGAQHVFGVFARLVFVEQRDDLSHHHLRRIVAQLLGDRDEPHAMLGQSADIHFQAKGVAEKARETVHDDDVERLVVVAGAFDHALEFGAIVVGGGFAEIGVFRRDPPAAGLAPLRQLATLVGDGEVALRLPPCRNAEIEASPHLRLLRRIVLADASFDIHRATSWFSINIGCDATPKVRETPDSKLPCAVCLWVCSVWTGKGRLAARRTNRERRRPRASRTSAGEKSPTRAENPVEEIGQPGFDHVDFGALHRRDFWPVVGDDPGRWFLFRPQIAARRRVRPGATIARAIAGTGALAPTFAAKGARAGHDDRIARLLRNKNGRRMRHNTLGCDGQKKRRQEEGPGKMIIENDGDPAAQLRRSFHMRRFGRRATEALGRSAASSLRAQRPGSAR